MPRLLPFVVIALASRISAAQPPVSERDSAALVQAAVGDVRRSYRPFANGVFVFDTANVTLGPLIQRVLAGLGRNDTISVTRTTPRARFSDFTFVGDTASVRVSVSFCTFEPREWISGSSATHRYIRRGEAWEPELRRSVAAGDGTRCPY